MHVSQPRPAHYQIAHQLLASDAHRPDIWPTLTGPNHAAYFAMKWDMAGGDPQSAAQIQIVLQQPLAGHHVIVVAMPAPMAPTEAHFVAYARPNAGGPLRYLVMEQGIQNPGEPLRAFTSEYRADGMRIRNGDLPSVSLEAFIGHLVEELTQSAPPFAPAPFAGQPQSFGSPPSAGLPGNPYGAAGGMPSTVPMAVPPRVGAPNQGGAGKWFVIGGLGLIAAAVSGYSIWDHMRMQAWQERRDAQDAAADEAEKANSKARKRAKARIDVVGTAYQTCLSDESKPAKKALEVARSKRALEGRNVRPKKQHLATLKNAKAYQLPSDATPVAFAFGSRGSSHWISTLR